jgi:uncharacterized protein YndB with AHSA1/START domain
MSVTQLAVTKEVTVAAPVERAFAVFTERIGSWWPLETYAIRSESDTATFEGREGGRVYERTPSGEEADWGRVLVWEPPHRVVFSWEITGPATEIEVRFRADGDATVVELEHRGWQRMGDEGAERRSSYDGGWGLVLGRYVEAVGP